MTGPQAATSIEEQPRPLLQIVKESTGLVIAPPADWRAFIRQPLHTGARVDELVQAYLGDLERRRSRSLRDYESIARVHLDKVLGAMKAEDVTTEHVRAWLESKRVDGYAPWTLRKLLTFLRCVFGYAVDSQTLCSNPCAAVRAPKRSSAPAVHRQVLGVDEISRLIHLEGLPFEERLLFAVLLLTGVRIGEASGLSWRDWSPSVKPLGELRIAAQWCVKEKRLAPTKTAEVRLVPVHPTLAKFLKEARNHAAELRGRVPDDDEPICYFVKPGTGRTLERWSETTALRRWKAALERIGAEPRVLHATRHTFVSALVNAGANPTAARSLTHAVSASSAYDRYVHLSWEAKCAAVLALDLEGGGR